MSLTLETSNGNAVQQYIENKQVTPAQLSSIVQQLSDIAAYTILDYQKNHVRTGQTVQSIEAWMLENTGTRVSMAVGSRTRGNQLRWLDRGRAEVRPIRAKMLRFALPSGIFIFTKYARATQGIGFMDAALAKVASSAPQVINSALNMAPT